MVKCLIGDEWTECELWETGCSKDQICVIYRGTWLYLRKEEEGISWIKK